MQNDYHGRPRTYTHGGDPRGSTRIVKLPLGSRHVDLVRSCHCKRMGIGAVEQLLDWTRLLMYEDRVRDGLAGIEINHV